MTSVRTAVLGTLAGLAAISGTAGAADLSYTGVPRAPVPEFNRFYLHVGPAGLFYSESIKVRAGGVPIPGADIRIPNSLTVAAEIGYFVTPNFAVGFAGGYPPLSKVWARGTLTGAGTLGKAVGGPMALTAQYHFGDFGGFRPYVGVGPSLMYIFKNQDGSLQNLDTRHALGIAGQIGFNYMFDRNWGVFVDLKKVYLRTRASGVMGGAPIRAKLTLDPLVLHTGVTYTF